MDRRPFLVRATRDSGPSRPAGAHQINQGTCPRKRPVSFQLRGPYSHRPGSAAQRGLILPSPVISEVDHLLGHRLGAKSRLLFYTGIVDGYYLVADLPRDAYARIADLNRQFADLDLGFVDAAIVALAETLGVTRVATADRRHFTPIAAVLSLELLP